MPQSAHDWFRPRLRALVADAAEAGFGNDVAVAVITDLMNSSLSDLAPAIADEAWNKDIGEPDSAAYGGPTSDVAGGSDSGEVVSNPLNHLGRNRPFGGSR